MWDWLALKAWIYYSIRGLLLEGGRGLKKLVVGKTAARTRGPSDVQAH